MTQKWDHDTPARDAQEGELKKWVPPKLVAPDRRVTSVGGGEAVQPAAAFAGESLREAQLASTIGCGLLPYFYMWFPCYNGMKLSVLSLTGVRRLSTRFNGVRGLLGGQRGEIRNLPWPPNKVFSFTQKKFLRVYTDSLMQKL